MNIRTRKLTVEEQEILKNEIKRIEKVIKEKNKQLERINGVSLKDRKIIEIEISNLNREKNDILIELSNNLYILENW
jgi:sucrose-6-phosphate hydrolase SacC (GH32 family)